MLREHGIQAVADVRRHPGSRRMPQFGGAALAETLTGTSVEYRWFPDLGGRRQPLPDSPNTAWRNRSFRGYADYLHTETFAESLSELVSLAHGMRTAVMCAEALWWRCHRALIADALTWLGFEVLHIMGSGSSAAHTYTSAVHLVDGDLTYQLPVQ
ncbi:MAG TPA: DUF488 domain-containing protein [Thermomicrobiales bacterium]|nr:DUF488 domain-containing protein [Thermomicrobiales bacterium]